MPKYESIQNGVWEARSLVKDKKNSKTYLVNVDFQLRKPDMLRIDVTTPIGAHVLSLAQTSDKMSYVIPQRKVYYSGKISTNAFSELISAQFDTSLLIPILLDQSISKKGWVCSQNEKQQVQLCENKTQNLKVEWVQRKGKEKTVEVVHPQFELQFQFHTFKEKSEIKMEAFEIQQPKGFKKI